VTIRDPWEDELSQLTRQLLEARWRHRQVADAHHPACWIVWRTVDGFDRLDLWHPEPDDGYTGSSAGMTPAEF
jgi:hypothetical protein